jgi:adenine deaminase
LPQAIKTVTELGANPKRICLCTDDRDADDLFTFGLDWVARSAVKCGMKPIAAWSCGSIHAATRYGMDGELGGLGHSRRADIVLLNDALEPQNTWYGGRLVVEHGRITPALEQALTSRYRYPKKAYQTVHVDLDVSLIPELPRTDSIAHLIALDGAAIPTRHETIVLPKPLDWRSTLTDNDVCFLTVVERHHNSRRASYGLLKNFGLKDGAVASSVGHDAHNLVVAGTNEADMRVALIYLARSQGGICVVQSGQVLAAVDLPIAGLLSDARATEVAAQTTRIKKVWNEVGCRLPYMGFNLLPLSVIPEIRLTDRGLVLCPEMKLVPLFEML